MGLLAQFLIVQLTRRCHLYTINAFLFTDYSVLLYSISCEFNRYFSLFSVIIVCKIPNSLLLCSYDSRQLSEIVHFHVTMHVNINSNLTYRQNSRSLTAVAAPGEILAFALMSPTVISLVRDKFESY